ncbi:MAG: M48 family metalloprotease [Verrucomicrobia bacterium]|nr:M48 family metalloprotease [Verrucomicrobiota bacterium]
MDFFQAQAQAQKRTKLLVVLFVAAVAAMIAVLYLAISLVLGQLPETTTGHRQNSYAYYDAPVAQPVRLLWDPQLFAMVAGGTILVIAGAALFKTAQLRSGGPAIAEMVGGRRVNPTTTDLKEKRLLNVVEEMSIASGIPVPAVYVLDDEVGLNAFAAGLTTSDAVVAVTRGTLEKLNRDELQGVVAHEFSHILNGDMRMNIRLVSVLFGIFVLTIIGRGLLRILSSTRRRKNKRDGRIVTLVVAIGVILVVVGYVGYFFGRLIQAAVSRQREFLADASAVQFTRNPGGIAGALKKIGGYALGGHVSSEKAAAIGHFFFAEGMRSSFMGLLATHPPLDERIRAIEPQFDGKYFEPPEVVDVAHESFVTAGLVPPPIRTTRATPLTLPSRETLPTAAIASIGTLTPEQVSNAQTLINEIPVQLRQAARLASKAPALIYSLLLDRNPEIHAKQIALLPAGSANAVLALAEPLNTLHSEHKLPLCQLAQPALRELNDNELTDFFAAIKALIEADKQVSIFEFALEKLLYHQLVLSHAPKLSFGAQIYSFQALREPILVVLSSLAHASSDDLAHAEQAFAVGAGFLKNLEGPLELLATESCSPARLDQPLDKLALAAGPIKQRLLLACAHAASCDGQIRVAEAELLRTFAACLDCPMPPLMLARSAT